MSMKGALSTGSVQSSVMNMGAPGEGGAQSTAEAVPEAISVGETPSTAAAAAIIPRAKRRRPVGGAQLPDPLFLVIASPSSDSLIPRERIARPRECASRRLEARSANRHPEPVEMPDHPEPVELPNQEIRVLVGGQAHFRREYQHFPARWHGVRWEAIRRIPEGSDFVPVARRALALSAEAGQHLLARDGDRLERLLVRDVPAGGRDEDELVEADVAVAGDGAHHVVRISDADPVLVQEVGLRRTDRHGSLQVGILEGLPDQLAQLRLGYGPRDVLQAFGVLRDGVEVDREVPLDAAGVARRIEPSRLVSVGQAEERRDGHDLVVHERADGLLG